MRAFLVLAGVVSLAIVVLLSVGIIRITQANPGGWPSVSVGLSGARLPTFAAETVSTPVTTEVQAVVDPSVEVVPAGEAAGNEGQAAPAAAPAN